jgi:hypothetical protein
MAVMCGGRFALLSQDNTSPLSKLDLDWRGRHPWERSLQPDVCVALSCGLR